MELTPALKQQLDAIGPVRHIVSPNYEHTKFARQWKDAYPEATLYGCPGLPSKSPDKQCVATCCFQLHTLFSSPRLLQLDERCAAGSVGQDALHCYTQRAVILSAGYCFSVRVQSPTGSETALVVGAPVFDYNLHRVADIECAIGCGRYDAEVGVGNKAPDSWLGEIEVTHLDYERVPVLGRSFFNEVHPSFPSFQYTFTPP